MTEKRVRLDSVGQATALYGPFDENIRVVERTFGVNCVNRDSDDGSGGCVIVSGSDDVAVSDACGALEYLKNMVKLQDQLSLQSVEYVCKMFADGSSDELEGLDSDCVCVTVKGKPIKPRTVGQRRYVEAIRKNTVVFGIGPAGTGKTFLAVAMAVTALRSKQVSRIVLTRPAVEAGEKLGFLPGDLQNKIDPYLRPLYDALFEMFGSDSYAKHIERGTIEIAPLAYMRGRTLDDAFIILDEAQNTTREQMKMLLTRLGNNSKIVVTGDITQIDLPRGTASGLVEAAKVLKDVDDIVIHRFTEKDVVRHRLVQAIILAYEKFEKDSGKQNKKQD
ncbi:MAG: PhoH family protein [Clostridia bacterium]|nr:PhoH family protein [Clostridia bacterium]